MKKYWLRMVGIRFFVCVTFLVIPSLLSAEDKLDVVVLDMNRVFQESIVGKAAIVNVEGERNKRGQVLLKIEEDLRKLDVAIQKQAAILSAGAIADKRELFEKKRIEGARAAQDAQRDLMKYQQAEFGKVLIQVDEIVKNLAAERQSRFIFDFDKRVVLYASDRLDLTDEMVEKLDERALKS